jgi:hypothetical protein
MKRAPNEKECAALRVSHRRPNISNRYSNSSRSGVSYNSSNSKEAVRLPELSATRDSGSRKLGREDNHDKRPRRGSSDNLGGATVAASRRLLAVARRWAAANGTHTAAVYRLDIVITATLWSATL